MNSRADSICNVDQLEEFRSGGHLLLNHFAVLANAILGEVEKMASNQNCREQGYDNDGANIIGMNSGVKTRILNINPRAFFTP
ncbi:hypothetical protein TNCV_2712521 [Trichonephila clavipes]|nr:hypothetical protein TNCV_2712521 [Trichonephila clavipes]